MASLTQTINRAPIRTQMAFVFVRILLARDDNADPDEIAARAYRLSDSFCAIAKEDWLAKRGIATSADAETNEGDAKDQQEAA